MSDEPMTPDDGERIGVEGGAFNLSVPGCHPAVTYTFSTAEGQTVEFEPDREPPGVSAFDIALTMMTHLLCCALRTHPDARFEVTPEMRADARTIRVKVTEDGDRWVFEVVK